MMTTIDSTDYIVQWGAFNDEEWAGGGWSDDDEQPAESKSSYQDAKKWMREDHIENYGHLHPERPYRIIKKTTITHVCMSGKVEGKRIKRDPRGERLADLIKEHRPY